MNAWARFKNWLAFRAIKFSGLSLKDPRTAEFFGGVPTATGINVNEDTCLTYSPVWAAVRAISENFAALPCRVYQSKDAGESQTSVDDPLNELLLYQPNSEMTAFAFKETLQAHVLLHGNAYAEIQRTNGGDVAALWPLTPNRVTPTRDNGKISYLIDVGTEEEGKRLRSDQVLHIAGLGYDGLRGYSVITMAAASLSVGMAAEQYGATFFGNQARPNGVLVHPGVLSPDARTGITKSWNDAHQGLSRSHRVALLEEGLEFKPLSSNPEEAQLLSTREFSISEVARWFNIQPHLLKDLTHATFSNIEQQSLEFVIYTLAPWFTRWEQSGRMKLLSDKKRKQGYFLEHSFDFLLRGDISSRYTAIASALSGGWKTINEIRKGENLPPVPGGDELRAPMNQAPVGDKPGTPNPKAQDPKLFPDRSLRCGGPGSGTPGPCPEGDGKSTPAPDPSKEAVAGVAKGAKEFAKAEAEAAKATAAVAAHEVEYKTWEDKGSELDAARDATIATGESGDEALDHLDSAISEIDSPADPDVTEDGKTGATEYVDGVSAAWSEATKPDGELMTAAKELGGDAAVSKLSKVAESGAAAIAKAGESLKAAADARQAEADTYTQVQTEYEVATEAWLAKGDELDAKQSDTESAAVDAENSVDSFGDSDYKGDVETAKADWNGLAADLAPHLDKLGASDADRQEVANLLAAGAKALGAATPDSLSDVQDGIKNDLSAMMGAIGEGAVAKVQAERDAHEKTELNEPKEPSSKLQDKLDAASDKMSEVVTTQHEKLKETLNGITEKAVDKAEAAVDKHAEQEPEAPDDPDHPDTSVEMPDEFDELAPDQQEEYVTKLNDKIASTGYKVVLEKIGSHTYPAYSKRSIIANLRCGGPGSGIPGPCSSGYTKDTGAGEKAKGWLEKAKGLPAKAANFAKQKATDLYNKMDAKYGGKWAKAILATAIVTLPLPGSTLGVMALTGIAHVASKYGLRTIRKGEDLTDEQIQELAQQLISELTESCKEYEPDEDEQKALEALIDPEEGDRSFRCGGPGSGIPGPCPEGGSGSPDSTSGSGKPAGYKEGRPKGETKIDDNAKQAMGFLFPGRDPENVRSLIGVDDRFKVDVKGITGTAMVLETWMHDPTTKENVYAKRQIQQDAFSGELICRNWVIEATKDGKTGGGMGTELLANQVAELQRAGVTKIVAHAALGGDTGSGSGRPWNGALTWPKLGYDAPLTIGERVKMGLAGLRVKTLQDLMDQPWGKEWWSKNAREVDVEFDLKPGSRSITKLNQYLESKGKKTVDKRWWKFWEKRSEAEAPPTPKFNEEIPPDWTDEDEKINEAFLKEVQEIGWDAMCKKYCGGVSREAERPGDDMTEEAFAALVQEYQSNNPSL